MRASKRAPGHGCVILAGGSQRCATRRMRSQSRRAAPAGAPERLIPAPGRLEEEMRSRRGWLGWCSICRPDAAARQGTSSPRTVPVHGLDDPQLEGALNVADLLTSIREELAARLEASREAVEESERLKAVLRVLDASAGDPRSPRSPRRAGTRGRRGPTAAKSRTQSPTPRAVAAAATLDAKGAGSPKGGVQRRRVRRS